MEITKLHLKNYKQFQDLEIDFVNGINLILGQNEAGKSTVAQALLDGLYLNPASRSSLINSKKSWQNEALSIITIEFLFNNEVYRLTKDFAAKRATLLNLTTKKEVEGVADVARALEAILPFKNAEMYTGTGFITHDDISKLHTNSDDLVNAIQNLAVNGQAKVKVKTILEKLEKQKRDLLKGIDRRTASDGKIKAVQAKIIQTENELQIVKEAITANTRLQIEQHELNILLEKLLPETAIIKDMLENNEAYLKTENRLVKVNQHFAQVQDTIDKLDKLQGSIAASENDLVELQKFLQPEAHLDLERLQLATAAQAQARRTPQAKPFYIWLVPLSIGFLLVFAGILQNQLWLSGIGLVLGVIAVLLMLQSKSKGAIKHDLTITADTDNLLAYYQCVGIQELREQIKKAENLANKIQTQKDSLQMLTAGQSLTNLKVQRNEILAEKLSLENNELNPSGQGSKLSQLEISRYRREYESNESNLKIAKERIIEIKALLKQADVNMEDLVVLEERLEILQRQALRLAQDVQVIDLITAGINHAIQDVASASAQLIEEEINKYLPALTLNRYTKVKLNSALELLVFSPEKNDWVNPSLELSRGTLDQIYFLARIAFIKLLTKTNPIPIILDDPFLTFDKTRRAEAVNILQELGRNYQVLLFSFNSVYRAAGNVIELG